MRNALPSLLVLVAALLLPLGLVLPILRLDRLWFLTEEPSLLAVVAGLHADGDLLLAVVVALASIVFPAAKLVALQLAAAGVSGPPVRHLHALGRWSMMDVVVVALVVFAAKTSGLAEAVTEPGLWAYAGSTVAAAVAALLLERGAPGVRDPATAPPR